MSYANHLRSAYLGEMNKENRQGPGYPFPRTRRARTQYRTKLLRMLRKVMGTFEILGKPSTHGLECGWASKKTKAKMIARDSYHLGHKAKPIFWRKYEAANFRGRQADVLIHELLGVPTVPLEPIQLRELTHVLDCRNRNKGILHFLNGNEKVLEIPYVLNRTRRQLKAAWADMTEDQYEAERDTAFKPWDNLQCMYLDDTVRPFFRTRRAKRGPAIFLSNGDKL